MNKLIIGIVVIAVVVVGGLLYFNLGDNGTGDSDAQNLLPEMQTESPEGQLPVAESPAPTSNPPAPQPTTHQVSIQGFVFSQSSVNVKKGDTVVWTNKDSAPHTVTGDGNQLSSQTLNGGDTYSFTFTNTGTFNYHCAFHPGMTGKVIVEN